MSGLFNDLSDKSPGNHRMGGRMESITGLDAAVKRNILAPTENLTPSVQYVA